MAEDPKKWWLISDEDVQVIRNGLSHSVSGETALHTLDSGLHETDDVPDDWKKTLDAEERKKLETELTVKFFDMEQKFIELGELCRDVGRLRIRLRSEG